MPVALSEIRAALLPGLLEVSGNYPGWDKLYPVILEPAPIMLGPAAVVGLAVVAAVIKNPTVSRRGLFGWFRKSTETTSG